MIASLCEEVQKLKHKLDVRNNDELCKDSKITSAEEERDEYKHQLEYKGEELYRMKREHREFEQFLKMHYPEDTPERRNWFGKRI